MGVLRYEKRNVLGFALDFTEDTTKSNWSVESTWIEGNQFQDNDQFDGLTKADTFNLTISADRPDVHQLPEREPHAFFFNTQWFFHDVAGWRPSFASTGPPNVLVTLHVDTGYFSDRMTPGLTFAADFNSNSGGLLPEISYHFTDSLSVTLAANVLFGRWQRLTPPVRSVNDLPYRPGRHQNTDWIEYGLSPIRDRDEVSLKIRYTF